MKNLIAAVLFIGVAAYIGMLLYESWNGGDWLKSESTPVKKAEVVEDVLAPDEVAFTYPDVIEVVNSDGRELTITLLARNSTYIQFERSDRSERFIYPISDLNALSRQVVMSYPEVAILELEEPGDGDLKLTDAYIEQLELSIAKVDKEIALLKSRFQATDSDTSRRTIVREIEALTREKLQLQSKIAERM
ncbi:MAG: hypothetical protein ACON4O_08020 [Lentimonas sp.]